MSKSGILGSLYLLLAALLLQPRVWSMFFLYREWSKSRARTSFLVFHFKSFRVVILSQSACSSERTSCLLPGCQELSYSPLRYSLVTEPGHLVSYTTSSSHIWHRGPGDLPPVLPISSFRFFCWCSPAHSPLFLLLIRCLLNTKLFLSWVLYLILL